jgi:hypothetical protein
MRIGVGSNQYPTSDRVERQLLARRVAVHIAAAIEEAGARFVLLTSPGPGEGKTTFMDLVGHELAHFTTPPYHLLRHDALDAPPSSFEGERVLLVHGPPMLHGEEILNLRDDWMDAFDGALIVVMGRRTRRDDLRRALAWLEAVDIRPLGLIYNEVIAPPFGARLDALRRWLRRPSTAPRLKAVLRLLRLNP